MSWLKRLFDQSKPGTLGPSETHSPSTTTSDRITITAEQMMREMGAYAEVDGVPTHSHANLSNCLETMLRCCAAEEQNYWRQAVGMRICAAPFYFERAAILYRKQRDAVGEITVCSRWVRIAEDYKSQPKVLSGDAAAAHEGPRSQAIYKRLAKAKATQSVQ